MNASIILFICLRVLSSLFMILLFALLSVATYRRLSPVRNRRKEIVKIPAFRFARGGTISENINPSGMVFCCHAGGSSVSLFHDRRNDTALHRYYAKNQRNGRNVKYRQGP